MPDLTTAIRAAVTSKDPAAQVVERWRNGIKHQLDTAKAGGRAFVSDHSIGSYHFLKAGVWTPINTDWLAIHDEGFASKNDQAAFTSLVAADGSRRIYPNRDQSDAYMDLGAPEFWDGVQWQPMKLAVTEKSATEALGWDNDDYGIDVVHTGDQLKLTLTLKTEKASSRVRWPLKLAGLELKGNLIMLKDEAVCEIASAWAQDAKGQDVPVKLSVADDAIEYEADTTGAAYPVTVDPTIDKQVGAGANDGQLYSGSSGFSSSSPYVYVGYRNNSFYYISSIYNYFSGISGLSGATITTSYLTMKSNTGSGSPLTRIRANYAATPSVPTDATTYNAIAETSASAPWTEVCADSNWHNSPSLNTVIQELATNFNPSGILIMHKDDGTSHSTNNYQQWATYDSTAANAAKLHIEYTAAAAAGFKHYLSLLGVGR